MSDTRPIAAPPLDPRSADDVLARLEALLKVHAPTDIHPGSGAAAGIAGVFARYAELVIERLNRAPDKNRLAFYDLIGASPQPPQPARVPLQFALAVGAAEARVPARTPVAAPAGPGRAQPVVYETERELSLSPVRLTRLIAWDAPADAWADHAAALDPAHADSQPLFRGDRQTRHWLYFGQAELLRFPELGSLAAEIEVPTLPPGHDPRTVLWEIWDGQAGLPIPPSAYDQYGKLTRRPTEESDLSQPAIVPFFQALGAVPETVVAGIRSRWLRAGLQEPITQGSTAQPGRVRESQLPALSGLKLRAEGYSSRLLPDQSFSGQTAIDTSKDFLPFGERPVVGACWYIGSREVLSKGDLIIGIELTQSDSTVFPVPASSNIVLAWEYWNGRDWALAGESNTGFQPWTPTSNFSDTSASLTQKTWLGSTPLVQFRFAQPPQPTRVNGIDNYWLRVRILRGGYGTAAAPKPPSLAGARLYYMGVDMIGRRWTPDAIVRDDGLSRTPLADTAVAPVEAFRLADDRGRSLYLGFELPAAMPAFPQRSLSLYVDLIQPAYGTPPDDAAAASPARLEWSCWNGSDWARLPVLDETAGFSHPGLVEFLPPADFAALALFGDPPRHWLRVRWISGDYRYLPRLRRVLQHATMAVQATTVGSEILGSSNGEPDQRFRAARKPLLAGFKLEVREPALPSAVERAALIAAVGVSAIGAEVDGGVWLRWHAVGDFHASGPRDRHYVVDHLSGELRFGNGRSGLIPPRGAGNIRLRDYQSGGGPAGNAAAGAITQLKTSLPSVSGVSQPLPSTGGVPAESTERLLDRVPRSIRHGDRAVTAQDFEDLARLASTEVARSLCVPLADIRDTQEPALPKPGVVSLVIVPHAADLRPTPGAALIAAVRAFLDARRLPGVELVVLGAEYVRVDVEAALGITDPSMARAVEQAALDALRAFLHPLTGGRLGSGWDFGRRPHASDLHALLEGVAGVDHVRKLVITEHVDRPGANATSRFLVCSGDHRISLHFGA
ncbi:putative baseplate assembly protein [Nevskia sp.]|uniref:putative baseplate assembly protein n=1 Tax=Nevskia sp. TaxID=1929292 RepID=UPI0025DB4FF3|nr:putative baseplate assembly protein [Nevskia sp.]